jgi:hypothetical protein
MEQNKRLSQHRKCNFAILASHSINTAIYLDCEKALKPHIPDHSF